MQTRRGGLTFVDVALDHDTHDGILALLDLLRQCGRHLGLVLVVLEGVAVAAVHHEPLPQPRLLEGSLGLGDALGVVVGAPGTAAQNDEAVLVADGTHNGNHAGLRDRQEVVGVLDSADRVDGDGEAPVGAILEAHREAQTTGQLTVKLALCCPGADGADTEQIGQELRADGIQHLAGNGHALGGEVDEQLPAQAQALVDLEAVVNIRVVDQALPPNRCARLLEVGAHHDQQLILVLLLLFQQQITVLEGSLGVVDGAGPDDHHQPVLLVGPIDNSDGLLAALDNGLLRLGRLGDFVLQQVGGRQRVVAANWSGSLVPIESAQGLQSRHVLLQSSLSALLPTFLFSM